nr:T9SS type A sorting domain-containing protein [Bacteroidota bacterium]
MKKNLLIILLLFCSFNECNAQWTKINLPNNWSIAQMQFVNDSVGYMIADSIVGLSLAGKIFKTFDRGLNWYEKSFYYQSFDYLYFINEDTGWICMTDGGTGTIRRTINGGNTWTNICFNAPHGPMFFVTPLVGYIGWIAAGAQGAVLHKTIDGGITWNSVGVNLGLSGLQDMVFADSVTGYVGGLYGPTLGRLDLTVPSYNVFSTNIAVSDMDYENASAQLFFTGEEFGVNSGLYKTTSNGSPINLILDAQSGFGAYSVNCKNANEILCGGYGGLIAFSYDGGINWNTESTNSQTSFTDVHWGSNYAIAAGGDGEVYRKSLPLSFFENSAVNDFGIYPNPAENIINIKTKIEGELTVTIYDVLQKKVLEQKITPFEFCTIDVSALQKAFYTVVLSNAKKEIIGKQKLLLK